jgi:hypothetical protein
LHAYLAESGVDGVKVDAQSGLGALAAGIGGGPHVVRQYTAALEASVRASFGAQHAINCMCHSTENLYAYQHTAMARASDDFYPKDSASQTWHVAAAACNSLFIGEIAHTDWDMVRENKKKRTRAIKKKNTHTHTVETMTETTGARERAEQSENRVWQSKSTLRVRVNAFFVCSPWSRRCS